MEMILASGSPRRKELLEQAGFTFRVEVSDADENIKDMEPPCMVEELSCRKAAAVASLHQNKEDECIIIGADTIVVLDREVLGKPKDEKDAERMLRALSGREHHVYTGVTVLRVEGGEIISEERFHECTIVDMRPISDREIGDYIAGGEPMDKAGAYGIQGRAAIFIRGIRGDYYNVVGLPICHLASVLQKRNPAILS